MSYIGNPPTQVAFLTDQFSGNGSTTAFTMSVAPATTTSVLVAITGVLQDPTTYSVVGTTLTFSAAPPSGTGNISVRYMGIPASGVTTTAYRTVTEFTATAGQTTFTPPSYTVGFIAVYRNGVRLGSADYTASNGTTVVLTNAATLNDLVVTESFYVSSVLNAIPATAGSVQTSNIADANVTTAKIADANVTQAKLAANVAGNGPAFSAYANAGITLSNAVLTQIPLQVELFDTASCFNNTAGTVGGIPAYSFLPNVAGYYMIFGAVYFVSTPGAGAALFSSLLKNGSEFHRFGQVGSSTSNSLMASGGGLVYLNGSTDYISLSGFQNSGSSLGTNAGLGVTYFQGSLVRAA